MKKVILLLILIVAASGCAEQTAEDALYTGHVAEIQSIEVYATSRNWDADAEEDGVVIHISFYDKNHEPVWFKDQKYLLTVKIFTIMYDQNFNPRKGRLVYNILSHYQVWLMFLMSLARVSRSRILKLL